MAIEVFCAGNAVLQPDRELPGNRQRDVPAKGQRIRIVKSAEEGCWETVGGGVRCGLDELLCWALASCAVEADQHGAAGWQSLDNELAGEDIIIGKKLPDAMSKSTADRRTCRCPRERLDRCWRES